MSELNNIRPSKKILRISGINATRFFLLHFKIWQCGKTNNLFHFSIYGPSTFLKQGHNIEVPSLLKYFSLRWESIHRFKGRDKTRITECTDPTELSTHFIRHHLETKATRIKI